MPETDIELLISAAQAAGEIATKYFKRDPEVWDKPDGAGPVTEADLAVDKMLTDRLCGARPDYGWLSEETEDDMSRLDTSKQFIIDPIDGTRAFIEGNSTWAHSLAICENGQITHAVVNLPMLDRMFVAEIGKGATLNGTPISVSDQSDLSGATLLAAKPNLKPEFWAGDVPAFDWHFRSSLAYRLSLIGQGRFDTMLTLRKTWEWDVAAGTLIVTEAGGVVTTRTGAKPVFNNAEPALDCIVAAGPMLHPKIITALA